MKKIIALNWKDRFEAPLSRGGRNALNGVSNRSDGGFDGARDLLKTTENVANIFPDYEWVIFPGDEIVDQLHSKIPFGNQIFSTKNTLSYCLVAHMSQRISGKTNQEISQEMGEIAKSDITPFLCIGPMHESDTLEIVLKEQLTVLEHWPVEKSLVIAYEPGFSIGNGKTMTLEDIGIVYEILSKSLERFTSKRIIYGGSVNDTNIAQILTIVDGVIIGAASQKSSPLLALSIALGQEN